MQFRVALGLLVVSTLAASTSAFSLAPAVVRNANNNLLPASALCMSGDDDDDFFSDYDPSQYESYNTKSYSNDDRGGGGGYSSDRGGGYSNRGGYSSDRGGGGGYGRGRGGGRGGGYGRGRGGGGGRVFEYSRDVSRDNSNVDEAAVEDLVRQRAVAKRDRDYDTADAIREQLMNDYKVGIDDRENTWRSGVSSSGSGRGNFGGRERGGRGGRGGRGDSRRPRQDFGPNGHDYAYTSDAGPNASGLSDQDIHGMIAERLMAKLSRDFGTADAIQVDLVARGVFVHDGIKEWRSDGVAYGDFNERRGNDRGNPGRMAGSRSSEPVNYRKSSYSEVVEGVDDDLIDKLVAERMGHKIMRDFDKADSIREGLRTNYNVLIDDRLKMWSVGGDFGEEHNQRRELSHQFATRGYVKSSSSLPLSPEDEATIQEQLDARGEAKRDRDFNTADEIRENLLQQFDVSINDKMKLWSVGGAFEESGGKVRAARGVYTRRGGGDLSEEALTEITELLMERYQFKKERDFDSADAIRDDLEARYSVKVDDRSSEWRIDTDEYVATSTGKLSAEIIEMINGKLAERFQHKRDREYEAADAIRDELGETYGVHVDDRTKEWHVNEIYEDPQQYNSAPSAPNTYKPDEDGDDFFADLDSVLEEELEEKDGAVATEVAIEDEDVVESTSALTEEELSKFTIPILKEKLRDAGLPVSGKKAELIARLLTQ